MVLKSLVKESKVIIRVYSDSSQWFGLTYPEDKDDVVQKLSDVNGYR